jgi:hypothetical protein
MFGLTVSLGLLEGISNSSNRQSIVKVILVYFQLTSSLIWIVQHFSLFVLITFHGKGFTRTCLTISKNGGMESIDNFSNETTDLQLIKHIFLGILLVKYFIKTKVLLSAVVRLVDTDLIGFTVSN